jgi:hypothetical protein
MIKNRPEITEERVREIIETIAGHPEWNRTRISKSLCEDWGWKDANGQLKDISARDMLRSLDKAGKIELPRRLRPSRLAGARMAIKHLEHDTSPVECGLRELAPLDIRVVRAGCELDEFKSLIDQFHYLGFDRTIGENMKYMVRSRDGAVLACLLFGCAAWACRSRDEYIGWAPAQRRGGLPYMANNARFIIPQWVKVPHLASHILGKVAKRVSADWESRYGHNIYCLETFVERDRFRGTCYKASNWINVGSTTGRGRNSAHSRAELPINDVWVYPLAGNFRQALSRPKE